MQAVFRGKNGSRGFIKGMTYNIKTVCRENLIYLHEKSGLLCPYESVESLLRNWKIIENQERGN